ncbi:Transcriptional regulator GlxA family, contains an amidase domain and an AraC-type DNA-binding HTH domain [Nonomuraea maritima]|uniref:Transcriptional regulator GlxA family, contains an amidase domain and an AraC-type DNA-binding HTH domain n=1 Tax=Nonomuraea maritima TaxID=683260 RepID=A0A1G9HNE1_9ACTN|nr:GlxA family transcriptional regulator [Nonomuraea maritima]SDL14507.1 Transcriptional regulator GlxA family, contains an amidase domain and an AraC-type DNA-binding HTH domain [Nonomuraea maritima]
MRRVLIVIFPGFQLLDLAGPADVFGTVAVLSPEDCYQVEVVAVRAGEVTASNGVTVTASALGEVAGPIDTVLVAGGWSVPDHVEDEELVAGITALARRARRVASVCNGAFLLAQAGLLEGRRATTHWVAAEDMRRRYSGVEVDADPLYIEDGDVWTAAGVLSGVDLALALVARDHGHALAAMVARGLVVYLHRAGGQSQFSTPMRAMTPRSEPLRELQAYIDSNPCADLSVPTLAARAGMSERHFSRVFTEQTGVSPGRYVERSRGESARRLLEVTGLPMDTVARQAGLGSPETLYRVFRRHWRITPGEHRRRFRSKER